jgi:hypothetical protein
MLTDIVIDLIIIAFATGLIWQACDRLERASHNLALIYGRPDCARDIVVFRYL